MDIGDNFYNSFTPLKGLYIDSLNICELFLYVKMQDGHFGKTPKIQRHKTGKHFYNNCRFFRKIAQYTIERVNSVLGYSKITNFKKWLR